jgi:hypothetical protein
MASLLAFRPASAVHRLAPRNEACPLSLREVARGLPEGAPPTLIVAAPHPAIARAALMAAKGARAAVGIALPGGAEPGPWFAAVAQAADDLAPRLPFFACADVAVGGGDDAAIDAAFTAAHRLVEAGVTHLAVDVAAVPLARRAEPADICAAARYLIDARAVTGQMIAVDSGQHLTGPLVPPESA